MGPIFDSCKLEAPPKDLQALTNFEAHSYVLVKSPLRLLLQCWNCDLRVPMGWRWDDITQPDAEMKYRQMQQNQRVNTFMLRIR